MGSRILFIPVRKLTSMLIDSHMESCTKCTCKIPVDNTFTALWQDPLSFSFKKFVCSRTDHCENCCLSTAV